MAWVTCVGHETPARPCRVPPTHPEVPLCAMPGIWAALGAGTGAPGSCSSQQHGVLQTLCSDACTCSHCLVAAVQELQYCAAVVAQRLADHGFGAEAPPLTLASRKALFNVCAAWSSTANPEHRERMMAYAMSKVKDPEARALLEVDMSRSVDALRVAALQVRGRRWGGALCARGPDVVQRLVPANRAGQLWPVCGPAACTCVRLSHASIPLLLPPPARRPPPRHRTCS